MATPRQQPRLPTLFFALQQDAQPVLAQDENSATELPAELLHHCLVEFADWGDLAKLACVQKSWSQIMMEAANQDRDSKWELAQALLKGEAGLHQNYPLAVQLLSELAGVEVNEENLPAIATSDDETADEAAEEDNNSQQPIEQNDVNCFSPAIKALATCYFEGHGVAKNSTAGVAWLRAAHILAADMDAAHDLALVYEYGRHEVEIDIVQAAEWFKKAALHGHIEAMAELGLCYELGCGVEQSDTEALDWYVKAANAGHITSKFSVAEAYEEAKGVPKDDSEACLWYYKAAIEGDHDSKMALKRLEAIARIVLPGIRELLDV